MWSIVFCQCDRFPDRKSESLRAKKEVHPGFEPGLLEGDHSVKIQSDNHYTNEPAGQCCHCELLSLSLGSVDSKDASSGDSMICQVSRRQ